MLTLKLFPRLIPLLLLLGLWGLSATPRTAAASAGPKMFRNDNELLACTPDIPKTTAYFPLDSLINSQVLDVVGTHTGSCSGTNCPTVTAGHIGSYFSFDGTDKANIPDAADMNWKNTDSFSFEAWVKMSSTCTAKRQVFFGKYKHATQPNETSWWVGCEVTNKAAFNLRDSTGQYLTINGGPVITDGNWHHIVAVRDGTLNRNFLYVDGVEGTSQEQTYAGDFTLSNQINLGYYNDAPYNNFYPFTGDMDEIAFYNQALSAADVQRHYNGGNGQSLCNSAPEAVDDGPFIAVKNTQLVIPDYAMLVNDVDVDGDTLSVASVSSPTPSGGTVLADGGGTFTYTPPANYTGSDSFQYTISDGKGGTDTATVLLTVRLTNNPPVVTPVGNQNNPEGTAVSLQIQSSDPDGDVRTYSASNLPDGLSIDRLSGLISGTIGFAASTKSPYSTEVTVTDAGFLNTKVSFTWTVTDVDGPPVVKQPSNQFNVEGETISVQIEATDPENDPLSYSASGLPSGLQISPTTGLISGTLGYAASAGSPHTVTVTVSDTANHQVTLTFTWVVTDAGNPQIYLPIIYRLKVVQ